MLPVETDATLLRLYLEVVEGLQCPSDPTKSYADGSLVTGKASYVGQVQR